jgi:hypothetical protein
MLTRAHLERARLDRLTSAAAAVEAADVERSVSRRRRGGETRAGKRKPPRERVRVIVDAPFASHTPSVRSSEHVTIRRPVPGSNPADHTVDSCPPSFAPTVTVQLQSSPPGSSVHTLTVSSYETETRTSSVGCQTTCLTSCVCPFKTATHSKSCPGWSSQIHTDLSRPHVANSWPLGDHAQDFTSFSWPSTTATHSHSPPCCAHTAVLASKLAVARSRPGGRGMRGRGGGSVRARRGTVRSGRGDARNRDDG